MSFGFGVGDIVLVTNLAWKLYKGFKDSSQDFRRMSMEIVSLHAVLTETREFMDENGDQLDGPRKDRLGTLIQGCLASLQELEALYVRYESLSTQRQRTWDRMRFGLADLSEVRQRLILNTTLLTSFTAALVKFNKISLAPLRLFTLWISQASAQFDYIVE
ncbi:ANK-REP-REGION domain-containing protein [Mycena sanguinolenta]|uniref:ANK-REP-REGION domain-containing protein n=1 Tax=Mycena sanguinolenta TaxID=230812 RepID=A0A8H6Y7F6_9AGAR|nr:ANK-REP-REGION domain-containing protein [Mycena sanguinolenta]